MSNDLIIRSASSKVAACADIVETTVTLRRRGPTFARGTKSRIHLVKTGGEETGVSPFVYLRPQCVAQRKQSKIELPKNSIIEQHTSWRINLGQGTLLKR